MEKPAELEYFKTDRNGTKYYYDYNCPKCGGYGWISGYEHVEGGRCFKCDATGRRDGAKLIKVMTPEYEAKLKERRKLKAIANASATNAKWFEKEGFNANGETWVVLGNTYDIKDALKAAGAKFNGFFGWHFDHETNYPAAKLTKDTQIKVVYYDMENDEYSTAMETLLVTNFAGEYDYNWNQPAIEEHVQSLQEAYRASLKPETSFYGVIKGKVKLTVKYIKSFTYSTHYTYYGETHYIHKFTDGNGHVFTWNTSSPLEKYDADGDFAGMLDEGATVALSGTIKEHKEYKGEKETVLTRCRYTAA